MATTAELETTLAAYRDARDQILSGRTTTLQIEGQSYSFLSLPELEKQIASYENRVAIATRVVSGASAFGIRGRLGGQGY